MAAVHAHLRVVGMHSGFCCVAAWYIGSVLPYPLFNSSNLNNLVCFPACLTVCL